MRISFGMVSLLDRVKTCSLAHLLQIIVNYGKSKSMISMGSGKSNKNRRVSNAWRPTSPTRNRPR